MSKKSKREKAAVFLILIAAVGILVHAAILSAGGMLLPLLPGQGFTRQILLRQIAENFSLACTAVYMAGNMFLLFSWSKKYTAVSFRKLSLYALLAVTAFFVPVIPFGLLNPDAVWDFLFPVWSVLASTFLFYIAGSCVTLIKRRRPAA